MKRISPFLQSQNGSAGVEMALILPIVIALMFGSFELGSYFYYEHKVVKAVRDGARFAGRQPFAKYTCSTIDSTTEGQIKELVRTGKISGGTARIHGWLATDVTVSVNCPGTALQTGIYKGLANAPRVTVSASVKYPSLFGLLGFDTSGSNGQGIRLNATSQAAVMGI